MDILSPLLFGISANLDALLIGASYGFRKIHISFRQNLLISFITFLGSFLSIGLGRLLEPIFPANITAYVGSVLLILFGGYLLGKGLLHGIQLLVALKEHETAPSSTFSSVDASSADAPSALPDKQNVLSPTLTEVVALGIMLSMNNIGIGFGTGMAGITMLPTMIVTLSLSLLFMTLGNRLGASRLLRSVAVVADPLSGILLICLGVLELL